MELKAHEQQIQRIEAARSERKLLTGALGGFLVSIVTSGIPDAHHPFRRAVLVTLALSMLHQLYQAWQRDKLETALGKTTREQLFQAD